MTTEPTQSTHQTVVLFGQLFGYLTVLILAAAGIGAAAGIALDAFRLMTGL